MVKLFVVIALVGMVLAAPPQRDDAQIIIQCFNDLIDSIEMENVEELVDIIRDARETVARLIEGYRYCQNLPRDDPPTRLQEIAIAACERAWQLRASYEMARLALALTKHVENGRELIEQFSECSGISIPWPEEGTTPDNVVEQLLI
ncbi:uncharacterized protein LOC129771086 [Toxorhynchites rutilus septentrionalis]|uniref:uncharacterized protein LOC129771086 n=1 Tax=Toxorhynchites rutilus septentrionalis TaxID=329112 RepID=UPI002479426C|nr:uncharacterized protein LOC129771086 [Toxorhynchites rutilus septentrionalis]